MEHVESIIAWLREAGISADCTRGALAAVVGLAALKLLSLSAKLGGRLAKRVLAKPPPGELCNEIVAELEGCAASWDASDCMLGVGRLEMRVDLGGSPVEIYPAGERAWNMIVDLTARERKAITRAALAAVRRAKEREAQAHYERSLRMLAREPECDQGSFGPTEGGESPPMTYAEIEAEAAKVDRSPKATPVAPQNVNDLRRMAGLPPITPAGPRPLSRK